MKRLLIIAVLVASSFVGVKGAAAAGPSMGAVSLPANANPANLMTGTTFGVDTAPITHFDTIPWQSNLDNAENAFYGNPASPYYNCVWDPTHQDYYCPGGPLEAYTIACWGVAVDVVGPSSYWECGAYHSNPFGPNASESAVAAQFAIGSLDTTGYNECSWLTPYDLTTGLCDGNGGNSLVPGNATPLQTGNLMPDLDPYVGKTVNLYANENWCTYLAPPNYDVASNVTTLQSTGCYGNGQSVGIGLLARTLAANDGPPVVEKVSLPITAGPTDCHVPKVKGLTLRKAKIRLLSHNCRAAVRYVRGKVAGRVRYQPLPVGTGRPRHFKVKLSVVK